ncbi:collagen-like protein [Streptomyces sp. NPDC050529]|uniref:collagen-like protein n=1 Tax=Streptomyces sp. NPDC050529 TaxID=3365624 RepID=UPI0037B71F4C
MKPLTRVEARKERKRGNALAAVAALFAAVVLGVVVTAFVVLNNDLDEANKARDALARQVQSLGEKPVAGPPGSRGEAGETVIGQSGPPGPTGSPGPTGPSGKPAPTITPSPGPTGATGPSGRPGADSTAPGPSGSPGQDATGAPGTNGQNGADGQDGTDGQDGSPPAAWTYTDPAGVTYQCTPVEDFDPANPRYRCTPTSTPPPDAPTTPDPSPNTSSAGLLGLLDRRRD